MLLLGNASVISSPPVVLCLSAAVNTLARLLLPYPACPLSV